MATRLTGFSKLIITILLLCLIFFGGRYLLQQTEFGKNLMEQTAQDQEKAEEERNTATSGSSNDSSDGSTGTPTTRNPNDNTLRVQLVTWGG